MTIRDKLFWLIALAVFMAGAWMCMGRSRKDSVSQGDGAAALIAPWSKSASMPEPAAPPQPDVKYFYFAATATDTYGQVSDYSEQAVFSRTNGEKFVTTKWDASPSTNAITNYTVSWGRVSKTYTNAVQAGTNLYATVQIVFPNPNSNLAMRVYASNANDLVWSSSLKGPWTRMNASSLSVTNPQGTRYYRTYSTKPGGKVYLTSKWQP